VARQSGYYFGSGMWFVGGSKIGIVVVLEHDVYQTQNNRSRDRAPYPYAKCFLEVKFVELDIIGRKDSSSRREAVSLSS
jgi:hypothetical protein